MALQDPDLRSVYDLKVRMCFHNVEGEISEGGSGFRAV